MSFNSKDDANEVNILQPMSDSIRSTAAELEAALSIALPAYMVPSVYIPVHRMPMTSSGKLDRRRLRTVFQSLSGDQITGYKLARRTGRQPSTKMEKLLAQLWEEVLDLDYSVGADDNFFKCTGDSISAMKLISSARSKGLILTVADIFRKPTLSELAADAVMTSGTEIVATQTMVEPFSLLRLDRPIEDLIDELALECHVESRHIQDIYPCTSLQQGLIALSNKDPGAYVAQNVYRLPSHVNLDRFRAAWQKVFEAEMILRTRIVYHETLGFFQVVIREPMIWHEATDISEIVAQHRHLPSFNGDHLSRYTIIENAGDSPHFVWTAHHAIYDGWCIPVMLERVEACYNDNMAVDMTIGSGYPRFVKFLTEIDSSESDEFWRSRLSEPESIQFPSLPTPTYQAHATSISSCVAPIVRETGSTITLPSLIRASWVMVLSIYSGSSDVVFGETLTGRDAPVPDLANIIGPTLATVPTRIKVNPDISIGKFLEDLQAQSADAIPYQYSGLQHIKRLNNETAIACDFQNLLAVHHDSKEIDSGFWDMQSTGTIGTNFYSYPLTVSCQIEDSSMKIDAHYDKDVISTWNVESLLRQFGFILKTFNNAESWNSKLGQIKLLGPEDEQAILSWNSEPLGVANECIHEVISRQVFEQAKCTLAIDSWDAKLTYWELDRLSTQLSHFLISQKLIGVLVPLCFDKSAFTVCCMLAVLKSGSAFVPLDPGAPAARLRDIIADTGAKTVLCSPPLLELCGSIVQNAIAVDLAMLEKLPEGQEPLPVVNCKSIAYVIYTSGSTGKPKGTIVEHDAFCASAAAHAPALRMGSSSRVLQFASYTFDASVLEILTTLTVGGSVCVPDESSRLNGITDVINEMQVTWALLTPSFIQTIQPSSVPTLKRLILGGEAMSKSHISTWADKVELINAYGPSECAVVATANPHMSLSTDPRNMGRAVGSRAWIVDRSNPNRLVPIGSVGELVIEGPILARGYLNNNAKTEEVFIQDPQWSFNQDTLTSEVPRRMYRTGDLVKNAPDGSLIFCGRNDKQVKIRGQRLELGEVEAHLRMDPMVQHALVTIPKSGFCTKRLVSILSLQETTVASSASPGLSVITPEGRALYAANIRERLRERLPGYMIPSNWIIVQSLPLLPSGKLDRRQIEKWVEDMSPETYHQISELDNESNQNELSALERQLQAIWGTALNLPPSKVSAHQNFLSAGGDSISAMAVVSSCRVQGLGLTVRDVIQSISELALKVTVPNAAISHKEELETAFDLSPIQRHYFESVGNQYDHFNQSVVLRLIRKISPERLSLAIGSLMRSHSMLRARFGKSDNGDWQQQISRDVPNSYRYTTTTTTLNKVNDQVETSQKSLDIQNGPVFAVNVIEVGDEGLQLIALVAHHLVIDVVSWSIVLQDLESALNTDTAQLQTQISFQAWTRLQAEQTKEEMKKNIFHPEDVPSVDIGYWGMEYKPNVYGDTIENGFEVDPGTTLLLLGASHESMQTEPVDVFLAAVLQSFRKVFQDRPNIPAIYNEGHGREPWQTSRIDVSRCVGWFTTMCPIYLPSNMETEPDLTSTIRWIKDLRNRIPDKGRPYFAYRHLTEEGKARFSTHRPEITFNYLGKMQQLERKDSIFQTFREVENYDIGPEVSRFALLEISAVVEKSTLKFSFSYNKNMKRQAKIRRWILECQRSLETAAKSLVQFKPEPTLSNFPLIPLMYDGISKLAVKLPQLGVSSMNEVEDIYPCSPTQQGILLAQVRNRSLYAYGTVFEARSDGSEKQVNARQLVESWQAVVRRHATLRTVFTEGIGQDGFTHQIVLKDKIARVSWLECEDSEVISTLHEQQTLDFQDHQPPHRFTVCKTRAGRVFCRLEISHSICDGLSVPILLRDLSKAYGNFSSSVASNALSAMSSASRNKTSSKVTVPLYSAYIAHIQSKRPGEDLNYWKAYLSGTEPCLLTSLNDGAVNRKRELEYLVLNLSKCVELRAFCSNNSVTLSNVLQLSWALVLRLYSGSDEVCFGYLSAGRDAPITGIGDDAVGAFINLLTCRIRLGNSLRLDQALDQIQTGFLHSMAHQTCSLADIQHELGLSGTGLFNTAFTFQTRSNATQGTGSGLSFNILEAQDPSEYDVTVNVESFDSRVEIHFGYWNTALSGFQALNMSETFEHVVNTIIEHSPQSTIGELDFFGDRSRQQVLAWNSTLPLTIDKCIHEIIETRALSHSKSAPAVTSWDGDLSYAELDRLCTRLASKLVHLGVGVGVYVPLCFEKTLWAVVSMIAVMKAGGIIVPLDHTHPESRLRHFVEDVEADLVLCSRQNHHKIASVSKRALVVDSKTVDELEDANSFLPTVSPNDAAYCIFTSGTTGRPKGTIVEHGAFCTSAIEHSKAMYMRSDSRVYQFASFTFDASIMEILTTLIVGACVCIPSDQERMNDISGSIKKMRVTWTLLTPSVASTLSPKSVPSLKTLVTGGEAMHSGHIAKWKGKVSLINAYGPSETSVIASTSTKVDESGNEINADPSNIGRAVGGRTWIVDFRDHNKLVPVGCLGELFVEGRTVARGYLKNESKTAEAFVNNLAWLKSLRQKERVYKTGDLARYNSDGSLIFVARKDTQIKLNGQRIELGEIEHHVKSSIPDDYQSAVELVAPMSNMSTNALAAFFSSEAHDFGSNLEDERVSGVDDILLSMSDGARGIAKSLDSSLATILPSYMIPSFYIPLTKMPLTSSGKLDRLRLRTIVQSLPREVAGPYRLANSEHRNSKTAKSPIEQKLQRLWEKVLGVSEAGTVGLEDHFFRLGGDSVASMKLVGAARSEGILLSVVDIFRNPRLRDMSSICSLVERGQSSEVVPFSLIDEDGIIEDVLEEILEQCRVSRQRVQDTYPCSLLQQGLITLSMKQAGAYVAQNIFLLPDELDLDRFKQAWQVTLEEVDILRTRIVHMRSTSFLQAVLHPEPIEWKDSGNLQGISDTPVHLPLHNGGSLTQYTIVNERASGKIYFVWSIHHALYDGWSLPMVLKKVEMAYNSNKSSLSRRPYASFIKYLSEVDEHASDEFWRKRLCGASPLHFPQNQHAAVTPKSDSRIITHSVSTSQNTTSMGITLPSIIRAAWSLVVASYSGSQDVVFGETLAGRDIPVENITEIVGPTFTTVPTRVQIHRHTKILHFLHTIQKMATEVIPYQHAGLQRIKRLDKDAELACDFQNLLVIQTAEEEIEKNMWDIQETREASNFFTYPLVLECKAIAKRVDITAHYDENILTTWEVQRIIYQLDNALRQLSDLQSFGANSILEEIQIFSPEDEKLVREWNFAEPELIEACIHEEIEEVIFSQPESLAISAWDGQLTYSGLKIEATRLAHHLITLGVGPEVFVPICMDKSKWAIVAILSILMAGGAYVPLDPNAPISRHREMIKDVHATIVLCTPHYTSRYASIVDEAVPISQEILHELSDNIHYHDLHRATSRNSCYAIFTSGSTGRPKATVVEHRAISTSSAAMKRTLKMKPSSRVFQFASFTFDVSVLETLTALSNGSCICLPSEDQRIGDVAGAIRSLEATWAFLTPSVANLIDPTAVPSLILNATNWKGLLTVLLQEVLVCGGEAMSNENVAKWASNVTLINGYGPTEASVIAIANPDVSTQRDPSNIGRALPSGRAWIVDPQDHNLMAPVGCVGELLLEGPLLAREYINNAAKTEEVFINRPPWAAIFERPHARSDRPPLLQFESSQSLQRPPLSRLQSNQSDKSYQKDTRTTPRSQLSRFSSEQTQLNVVSRSVKMYKTGDLVKYSHDGTLIFIGRKDHQVKLNGQRIEPGEIEHALDKNSLVQHALILLPKLGPFRGRLIAVATLAELATTEITKDTCELIPDGPRNTLARKYVSRIRREILETLPPHMIPASWLVVNSVPLLPSGKLDRRNVETWLSTMDEELYIRAISAEEEDDEDIIPVTGTSLLLQQIVSRVLNLPSHRVKLTKSFVALGGDSIAGMQFMSLCRKEKINFTLAEVLKSKSIHQLTSIAQYEDAVQYQAESFDEDFNLSPIQQLYFESQSARFYENEARFNQSFLLEITRRVSSQDVSRAIENIVGEHSMLRARFRKNSRGEWQQRLMRDISSSYRYRLYNLHSADQIAGIVANSQSSLDIQNGPLFVVDLMDLKEEKQIVFLAAHHLIIDMVSWRIILQDLEEMLQSGTISSGKPLSFQTWCALQEEHSRLPTTQHKIHRLPTATTAEDLVYWGMDNAANTYGDVLSESFIVNEAITCLALDRSHRALRTEPLDLFLAAITHSFSRVFLDRRTPSVFNESHGREPWDSSIDLSRTCGWFTTIAPVQVNVDMDEDDVFETVRRLKDNRRKLDGNGRPYFAHQFLSQGGGTHSQSTGGMEIIFNYLGRMQQLEHDDSLLRQWTCPEDEETVKLVADVGPKATRLALFEISAVVVRGQIQFSFLYNSRMKHQRDIGRWIQECQATFEEIVQRLSTVTEWPSFTLSDFPLLPISYNELDKIVSKSLPQAGISPNEVEDIYPCAPFQEGLLISQLKDPSLYHFHAVFEVSPPKGRGSVDTHLLFQAWQRVVDYHGALRTVFADSVYKEDIFNQIVVKSADSGAIFVQCNGGEHEALEALKTISILDANYKKQPRLPHQAVIGSTSSGKVYFKVEINHAVIDGASVGIMLRDLAAAYHGKLPDGPGPLYRDYVSYIKTHPADASIKFWKSYLEGAHACHFPVLTPASDGNRRLGSVAMRFGRFTELQDMCQKMNITLANLMQVAWGFTLRHHTLSDDVCFGYLTSGRDVPVDKIQSIIGAFVSILVCRIKFNRSSSIGEVFQTVQDNYLESLEHQHCSLAQIQHGLAAGRTLFNTAVSIQGDSTSNEAEDESISFAPVASHDPSEYAVTLNIHTLRGDEGIVLRYWNDILSEEQAHDLADMLARILDSFVDNPNQLVDDLDVRKFTETQRGEEPQAQQSLLKASQLWKSEAQLRSMVSGCVKEVLEQLFKSGALVSYDPQNMHKSIDIASQQAVAPMIDYSQIPSPPIIETIEKPQRKPESEHTRFSTRGPIEQKLLSAWSQLLQISEDVIENEANFFELGGDSIVAMQLVGAARDEDLDLTVANIFRHPTFADMAAAIRMSQGSDQIEELSDIVDYQDARAARSLAIQNAMYQRYSLLEAANVDTFLQENICPKVGAFRGGIIDVLPVTDFQALAVMGTLMESKWMLNYFFLEGRGSLDLKRLKNAISRVVDAFDILRTVFVPFGNRFFQVVLRKLQPSFEVHETDNLSRFTEDMQEKGRKSTTRLGESFLQFILARAKGSDLHRIIIRISHAQYDGVCIPRILSALQQGYEGQEIPSTPSFSSYVRDTARTMTDDHYLYWKTLLNGSSMTEIVQRQGPNYSRGTEAPTSLKRIIQISSLAHKAITPATVIKASWSFVLAQISASPDVVFGNVISGRNAAVAGVESMIGPCVNMVPVRVPFRSSWSVLDLFRHLRDQQTANMPFESLGFREIIKHCTEWPDWTNFSTICQHQNIQNHTKMPFGGNEYTLGAIGSQEDFADITILSTPQEDEGIEVCLIFTENSGVTLPFAEKLFESLCDNILTFSSDPGAALLSPNALSSLKKQILTQKTLTRLPNLNVHLKHISTTELASQSTVLRKAWAEILHDLNSERTIPSIIPTSSFYDLGGDIIGVSQVAGLLESSGLKIRVEDLVDHPIFADQLALIIIAAKERSEREEEDMRQAHAPVEVAFKEKKGLKKLWGKSVSGLSTRIKQGTTRRK
ncbi:Nonribosomal peptide synthetase [Lachnellula suecica]|uniref:Nonribosomal peptide synthetase n=1 Tax=Lachnellula suecica TaxID=602035 RepID=A0A8T9CH20_9HELO|nr:Nonribosomal peptide synthetase [Lachnellula suecica]